ncbi:MAG: hypothetical protein K0Q72_2330 [Armatimonadetes bacterium]|jgi:hypothetical protein|nr:hypothetical protein [Armatimonadota bacterium]
MGERVVSSVLPGAWQWSARIRRSAPPHAIARLAGGACWFRRCAMDWTSEMRNAGRLESGRYVGGTPPT